MIRRALTGLKQNLIYAILASLAAGLFVGQFIGPEAKGLLGTAVVPALFVMIYPMMINIDVREIVNVRRHLRPVGLSLLVNFLATPLIAVGLATVFFNGDPGYALGLYLIALLPTSGMTAAWSGLAGGDLAIVVVGPMLAGVLTRQYLLGRYGSDGFKRLKPVFGGVSSAGVMLIVFIATAMQSESILAEPLASAGTVVPLALFYFAVVLVGSALGRYLLPTDQSISLIYATSMRNLSVALAIVVASTAIPTEAVLPIALGYLIQPPLGALYMHYRRDIVASDRTLLEVLRSAAP